MKLISYTLTNTILTVCAAKPSPAPRRLVVRNGPLSTTPPHHKWVWLDLALVEHPG